MAEVFCIYQTLDSNKNGSYDKYNALMFSLKKKVCKHFVLILSILRLPFIHFKVKLVKITQNSVPSSVIREILWKLVTTITTVTSLNHSVVKTCKIVLVLTKQNALNWILNWELCIVSSTVHTWNTNNDLYSQLGQL